VVSNSGDARPINWPKNKDEKRRPGGCQRGGADNYNDHKSIKNGNLLDYPGAGKLGLAGFGIIQSFRLEVWTLRSWVGIGVKKKAVSGQKNAT
jgi:hypothetical protein